MKLLSGHSIAPLSDSERKQQLKDWPGHRDGLIRLTPDGWLLPPRYEHFADKIYCFEFKKSDVVILTWPKCGTTWSQEIVWNMRNNPNLDKKEAEVVPVLIRSPYIEHDMFMPIPSSEKVANSSNPPIKAFRETCPGRDPSYGIHLQLAECNPEPRTFKTHLPFSLLAPTMIETCKVIYVARNPKDVIVSFNHNCRIIRSHNYSGSFEEFVQYFLDGDILYGPYWLHVKEAWEKRDHPNLLFLFYEDLKADPLKEIKKIDAFLGTKLTEAQMNGIVQFTSFGEMKTRGHAPFFNEIHDGKEIEVLNSDIVKRDGGFFRKGESGGWRNKITTEVDAKIDDWIREYLDPIGITFKYEV